MISLKIIKFVIMDIAKVGRYAIRSVMPMMLTNRYINPILTTKRLSR